MSNVKERLIGAITVMDEDTAVMLWDYIQHSCVPRTSLDDVPEVEPTNGETAVLDAYERGVEEYQPYISEDDLRKELGI